MLEMSSSAPDFGFDNPPIVELVLGVQFEPLLELRSGHIGLFWSRIKDRYPETSDHPPLEPVVETFGRPTDPPRFEIRVETTPAPLRSWFLNHGGDRLLQLQRDRFIQNWRRTEAAQKYPSFDRCLADFSQEMYEFRSFLESEKLRPFTPNQCELTYVNHFPAGTDWSSHSEIGALLRNWDHDENDLSPEDVKVSIRYRITHKEKPWGRLHAQLSPKWHILSGNPIYELRLTARGRPLGGNLEGVEEFLKLGHEHARKALVQLTRPELQQAWIGADRGDNA